MLKGNLMLHLIFLQYYTGLLNNMANDYTLQFAWITDGPERDAMISRNLTGL